MIRVGTDVREVLNYIDGGWVPSSGTTFESRDPATGELVATATASTLDDVSAAIEAARRAFDETDWSTTAG
jgi:aldehyde dehydrogenase (NAD+)